MSTIHDVAKCAGVSVPTVYKVYDAAYFTSLDIQEKVFNAAKKLSYVHRAAYKKTPSLQKNIGIVFDDMANPFYGFLLRSISRELSREGYQVMTMYHNGRGDLERQILENMQTIKVSGVIVLPSPESDDALFKQLYNQGFPTIQLFRPVYEYLDTLLIDDELGSFKAIQNLLEQGHRKIMLISPTNPVLIKRENGYKRAFEQAGVEVDPAYIYLMNYENTKEMIKDKIKKLLPTAILSVGESISIYTLQALNELGLKIPEDIGLIVYDDLPWTSVLSITVVGHPFAEIGQRVSELILKCIEKKGNYAGYEPVKLMVEPYLISRNSVKSPGHLKASSNETYLKNLTTLK
jgi:DNA-binding LacI/PurR family transcriptional regulator